MPQKHSVAPARAPRSRRRTSLLVSAGLVVGIAGASALAATTPAFAAQTAAAALAPVTAATPAVLAATPGATTLQEVGEDARDAVGAARAALADAGALGADIAAAHLDLGVADTSVDTSPLLGAMDELDDIDLMPVLLLPAVTEKLVDATDDVEARVGDLRDRLDAALEKKAAEEAAAAAAAAAAEAERKAAEAAAEAARIAAAANTPEGAKAAARSMASSQYGWGADQFSCLESLWTKESGWNYQAYNASSGATGIPQSLPGNKMASAGADWQTNATTQIAWGLQYIAAAYGTPCSAWGHSQATDWY
ncbi:aggregation-promoting factor C-terminal-like domain-containing protein [Microbacterium gallinarum]|uniref:Phospholipase n=1 Tax=Microbacterium gallinarum TaxID=2762209 RepID=A0ABR8WZP3_9MICO|nr:phospholipase [Microbacterium gallinarum]MBD8022546.1 phospholipase [Microbacterium gallinarum]